MAILLEELTMLPMTTRIDGIMPFRIPQPVDVFQPVNALLDELKRMRLPAFRSSAKNWSACKARSRFCFLAILHRREFQIDHRLRMRLQVECPLFAELRKEEFAHAHGIPSVWWEDHHFLLKFVRLKVARDSRL